MTGRYGLFLAAVLNKLIVASVIVTTAVSSGRAGNEIWRASLVMLVSGSGQPVSMMLGEFPEIFKTERECEAFVDDSRESLNEFFEAFASRAPPGIQVLNHELVCMAAGNGVPL